MNSSSANNTPDPVLEAVSSTIARYDMINEGDTVVLAVSGGADSTALMHIFASLAPQMKLTLVAAHLNHGIREADAYEDAEFVKKEAERLGIKCVIKKVNVPETCAQLRMGVEEAARKARYEFLEKVARDTNADRIAVAHNSDDQVETVLINLIRGTGPDGLAGMPLIRGKIVRPLIGINRDDIESYLNRNGIKWRIDETNLQSIYTRNKVRLELIPYLQENFNPRIKEAVISLSELVRDETAVIRNATDDLFRAAVQESFPDKVVINAEMLRNSEVAIQRRCIRIAIDKVKGDLRDIEYDQIELIISKVKSHENFNLTLPSGRVYAALSDDKLSIFRLQKFIEIDVERELSVPGRTKVPELGISIITEPVDPSTRPSTPNQAVIDLQKLAGPLVVRTWKPGDRIQPFGMTGQKKLQDIFMDKKVPRADRSKTAVITDGEKIVWVTGLVASELVKVTEDTICAVLIEVTPM